MHTNSKKVLSLRCAVIKVSIPTKTTSLAYLKTVGG